MNSAKPVLAELRAEMERQTREYESVCEAIASVPEEALLSEEAFERVQSAFRVVPMVGGAQFNFMMRV